MNGKIYVYFNVAKYEKEGIAKYYVGQTINSVADRAGKDGKAYGWTNPNCNNKFANGIRKWGWNSFKCFILEENIETHEELNELEKMYIKAFDSFENGYNSTIGGEGINGKKMSYINRVHISEGTRNAMNRPEIKNYMKIVMNRPDVKNRISEANSGRIFTDEHRKKLSDSHKGLIPYIKGKHHNEETRQKIKDKLASMSPEAKAKIIQKRLETMANYTEEQKEAYHKKMSEVNKEIQNRPDVKEKSRQRAIGNKWAKRSKVKCIELDLTFESMKDAERYVLEKYNVRCSNIARSCKTGVPSGKIFINNKKVSLNWVYA